MLPEDIKESLLSSYISEDENQVRISARVLESSYGLNRNELLEEISMTLEEEYGFSDEEVEFLATLPGRQMESIYIVRVYCIT